MTAATERYLIESVDGRVDLCESQGDQWVTVAKDITPHTASRYGFNLDSPAVRNVFISADKTSGGGEAGWGTSNFQEDK